MQVSLGVTKADTVVIKSVCMYLVVFKARMILFWHANVGCSLLKLQQLRGTASACRDDTPCMIALDVGDGD